MMTLPLQQARTHPAPVAWPTTVRRTVSSELIKLRALRSSVWLLGVATAFTAILGPVQSLGLVLAGSAEPLGADPASDAVELALTGISTSSLLLGILGVLVVTGEYTSHVVRTTFTLVPQRRQVVLAKALALALATAVTSVVAVAVAVTVSLLILGRGGPYADLQLGWSSPHVVQLSAATVWYLVGWSVLGLAAGWLTRSKIGGAALLIGAFYLLAPLLGLLPESVGRLVLPLMPSSAADAMMSVGHAGALASSPAGFAIWTAYLVLFTVVSGWVVARRDA